MFRCIAELLVLVGVQKDGHLWQWLSLGAPSSISHCLQHHTPWSQIQGAWEQLGGPGLGSMGQQVQQMHLCTYFGVLRVPVQVRQGGWGC